MGIIYEELESKIDFEDTIIRVYAINEEWYAYFTGVHEEFILKCKNTTTSCDEPRVFIP